MAQSGLYLPTGVSISNPLGSLTKSLISSRIDVELCEPA
jgi:hypothetical protein